MYRKNQKSLGELAKWCIDYSARPDKLDKGFVLNYNVQTENKIGFRIFLTIHFLWKFCYKNFK